MHHRVDHALPHGHSDLHQIVVVETRALGHADRQSFGAIHALERGVQGPLHGFGRAMIIVSHTQTGRLARPKRI
jgi:hypothetical protein